MRMRVNYLTGYILKKGFVRKLLSSYIITLLLLMSFSVLFTSPGLANKDKIGSDLPDLAGIISSPSESVGGESLPKVPYNTLPVVSDIPDQVIDEGDSFETINLDLYVDDEEDEDEDIVWTCEGNNELIVSIDNRIATISVPYGWYGAETITFTATDTGDLTDSDEATFTVNQETQSPPFNPPAQQGDNILGGQQSEGNHNMESIPYDDDPHTIYQGTGAEPQGEDSSSSNSILTFYIRPDNVQHETGIVCIEVTPTRYFADIGAIVLNNLVKPQKTPDLPSENKDNFVSGYIRITLIGDGEFLTANDIEYLKIKFKVEKTWINQNNIDEESIVIKQYRHDYYKIWQNPIAPPLGDILPQNNVNGWKDITQTSIDEDEEHFYYEVDAPGCSATFAIIGTEIVEVHPYSAQEQGIPWTVIIGVIIASTILLVVILFKAGYIYTEEEHHLKKPQKTPNHVNISKIRKTIAVLLFWI